MSKQVVQVILDQSHRGRQKAASTKQQYSTGIIISGSKKFYSQQKQKQKQKQNKKTRGGIPNKAPQHNH